VSELDDVTARQLQRLRDWVGAYGHGSVPVLAGPPVCTEPGEDSYSDREIEFASGPPWLSGKDSGTNRLAMIRLMPGAGTVRLDTLAVHPRYAELDGYDKPEKTELEFPPPQCAYCDIDLDHDGDTWNCPQCRAWWADDGYSDHRRYCVEADCDGDEAQLVGEDGQPRCRPCQFLVLLGQIRPTGPYTCSNAYCRREVVGMPYDAKARRHGHKPLCGSCQQREESDAYFKDLLARRSPVTSAESL
jgi:hypothetical protein